MEHQTVANDAYRAYAPDNYEGHDSQSIYARKGQEFYGTSEYNRAAAADLVPAQSNWDNHIDARSNVLVDNTDHAR